MAGFFDNVLNGLIFRTIGQTKEYKAQVNLKAVLDGNFTYFCQLSLQARGKRKVRKCSKNTSTKNVATERH